MRIFDICNNEILNPDLNAGYLEQDKIFVQHHEATPRMDEQGHYEVLCEYPNGGKDVAWIVDVPASEEKEEWDEYEDILRYIEYPKDDEPVSAKETEPEPVFVTDSLGNRYRQEISTDGTIRLVLVESYTGELYE